MTLIQIKQLISNTEQVIIKIKNALKIRKHTSFACIHKPNDTNTSHIHGEHVNISNIKKIFIMYIRYSVICVIVIIIHNKI